MSDENPAQSILNERDLPSMNNADDFQSYLINYRRQNGEGLTPQTILDEIKIHDQLITRYINDFWTNKQRQACSLHEISYRACYKPQLPCFFILPLTAEDDVVYDPFSGRGTTVLEAGLLGRNIIANDINPLSEILSQPRFFPPSVEDVKLRLASIPVETDIHPDLDLSMFYETQTLMEIIALKTYLHLRQVAGEEDSVDRWIRMVATNRLTGHSAGFFSAYTLPPNQAVSPQRQVKINAQYDQTPPYRDTHAIILKKTKSLLRTLSPTQVKSLRRISEQSLFLSEDSRVTPEINSDTVQLVVTSPPFLDVVKYAQDNWLRCWFNAIDLNTITSKITLLRSTEEWSAFIGEVFKELYRVTRSGGWVAFEVGEVRQGTVNLDEIVVPLGLEAGFEVQGILINAQKFTKTANIWGVSNNAKGTNSNRIALFQKI